MPHIRYTGILASLILVTTGCNSSSTPKGGDEPTATTTTTSAATSSTTTPASCDCEPEESCEDAVCVDDCRPSASFCLQGTECDYTNGQCAPLGSPGILNDDPQLCGSQTCLAGSECSLEGMCVASPPCAFVSCDDADFCWGELCRATRPPGVCQAPLLSLLNQAEFQDGAADLAFDDACNAYAVTIISGTDYLRQLSPSGTLVSWDGLTNLNMGEVAAQRVAGNEFGGPNIPGAVVITYTCCAACGCDSIDPQGMAELFRPGPTFLPMRIEAVQTTGVGPFIHPSLDTGPQGLVYDTNDLLYVGKVFQNGDFWRVGAGSQLEIEVAQFPDRVYAAGIYGPNEILVSVAGGQIHRLNTYTLQSELWATLTEEVTDLQRDPFTGFVLASTSTEVVEISRTGVIRGTFTTLTMAGRTEISPDGSLYHLDHTYLGGTTIHKFPLPLTRP